LRAHYKLTKGWRRKILRLYRPALPIRLTLRHAVRRMYNSTYTAVYCQQKSSLFFSSRTGSLCHQESRQRGIDPLGFAIYYLRAMPREGTVALGAILVPVVIVPASHNPMAARFFRSRGLRPQATLSHFNKGCPSKRVMSLWQRCAEKEAKFSNYKGLTFAFLRVPCG
jgi:hypothetical protein